MGKAPQGFDTIAYNNSDYSEYLLIYLKDGLVVGICGMGRSMAFSDAVAGTNGNNLSASWNNSSDYKTASGKIGAKKATISAGETAYAFYDALGDNTIYCIQVYNPSSVKQWEDMIYGTTGNLSYNTTVTDSIAVEIGKMFNAFRSYRTVPLYQLNDGLAKCAQDYCNTADGNKIDPRNADDLLNILLGYGVDPMQWGEACYYDAADAISFTNSLIQLDNLYPELVGANASTWMHMGVGVAANSKHTYLTIDYVNEI